jgi:site-specific DNA-cytosine methylase
VAHNRAKHPGKFAEAEDLIPEFCRCVVEVQPHWFLMENVPQAPEPSVAGYTVLNYLVKDVWVGGETKRERRFCFGTRAGTPLVIEWSLTCRPDPEPAVCASGTTWQPVRIGGSGKVKKGRPFGDKSQRYLTEAIRLQGLPEDFLAAAPFTVRGKLNAIGNGVPRQMGLAVAQAVRRALAPALGAATGRDGGA